MGFTSEKHVYQDKYVILEIDGSKKLLKNGQWGNYIVTDNKTLHVEKIEKLVSSRKIVDQILGQVIIDGKVTIVDKFDTLSIAAHELEFDHLPHGSMIEQKYVRIVKDKKTNIKTAKLK